MSTLVHAGAFFTTNPLIAAKSSGHASESLNIWINRWANRPPNHRTYRSLSG